MHVVLLHGNGACREKINVYRKKIQASHFKEAVSTTEVSPPSSDDVCRQRGYSVSFCYDGILESCRNVVLDTRSLLHGSVQPFFKHYLFLRTLFYMATVAGRLPYKTSM